jgi:ABC transporter DrrB family efflux protein
MSASISHLPELEKYNTEGGKLAWFFRDCGVMVKRSLSHIKAVPDQLVSITIQPIMFVVLFRYVFGGAIDTGGVSYINFLMAGIFVQTAAFGATTTGVSLANDMQKGIMDRFRSLPMNPGAVLVGHVVADLARNAFATLVMIGAGLAVGFRPTANAAEWLAVFGLLMLFTFALSWVAAIVGLVGKSVEFVMQFSFIWIFPLTFISSTFVPTDTMPRVLQVFADAQPVTKMTDAIRALLLDLPYENHISASILWSIAILFVAYPTAIYLFNKQSK